MPSPVSVEVTSEEMAVVSVAQDLVHLQTEVVKRVSLDVDVLDDAEVEVFTVETI